ncbi:hypothetical protein [Actinocrispum wychmicini]|uniref:Cysteine dioxygenase type I n=1 Tax=Actinocrispum wychmicini TaxID=1213861 RepID=A0A4R2JDX0_9PSEU|nr:hypothetical protein [Actinocrispum wychmicini]TCO57144.1 hypothetical protein EV192_106621 [Actinocrispum wychmicini]
MNTIEIVPGLVLDDEMLDAATAGLAEHAPEVPALTRDQLLDPLRWWRVPGPDDDDAGVPLACKDEFVVFRSDDLTIKIMRWLGPDLRKGETSQPHTHAWRVMEAHPLLHGYVDDHWYRTATGVVVHQGSTINLAGDVNRIFDLDYHEVIEVVEPGRTLSLVICGPRVLDAQGRGKWGHLDLDTGCHVPIQRNSDEHQRFRQRLYRINPQHAAA